MKRLSLLAVFVPILLAVGCPPAASSSSNNKGKIEGTKWLNEATTIKGKEIPAESRYLEFTKDGKLIYDVAEGTYALGAGDQVTFTFDKEFDGQKTYVENITVTGDTLKLSDPTGTIVFTKIHDEKLGGSVWYNDQEGSTGKYRDLPNQATHLNFGNDGSVEDGGRQRKVGTFVYDGNKLTINFTKKFEDTEWKSKDMPVTDHRSFSMTDADGNVLRFKRSG
jgi:hypothetical protein